MATKDPFEAVYQNINLEKHLVPFRASVLRQVFGVTNRKKAAVTLNNELAHFESTFISTFIGVGSQAVGHLDVADESPNRLTKAVPVKTHWASLSRDWWDRKQRQRLSPPNYFRYGLMRNPTSKGKYAKPQMTLETYLTTHWKSKKILRTFGYVTEKDILFLNSRGNDVSLTNKKADESLPFLGKLKTAKKDIRGERERFTIGFRAFPRIDFTRFSDFTTSSQEQMTIIKDLIPTTDNKSALGYPLSKLTNNHDIREDRAMRPTVLPLLNWYYRVKLPHVFKEFYKTKGLVGN